MASLSSPMATITQQPNNPSLLFFAKTSDPILHAPCEEVCFPLSEDDEHLIASMLYSIHPQRLAEAKACWPSAAGMAANQWGHNKQIFLFGEKQNRLDFEVLLNPSYRALEERDLADLKKEANSEEEDEKHVKYSFGEGEDNLVDGVEGCFSVPERRGVVRRYRCILAEYQTVDGGKQRRVICDWLARVFQHETDHVRGYLYTTAPGKLLHMVECE